MLRRMNVFVCIIALGFLMLMNPMRIQAGEVNKGAIPGEHLAKSCKSLPWGAAVWDNPEAIVHLKSGDNVLWVDTRPASFFENGTVRGAVLLTYNKIGQDGNELTQDSLDAALASANIPKDSAKIVFFCQGPKCHRSYNASIIAVTEWGYDPDNVIWYRDGYPNLFKAVKADPKLKRKAKKYLSDDGLKQL